MADYQEHPSKVTTWRDGQFVVLQEAERADRTVWVAFDTDGDDASWEGLLATTGDDGKVTVQSVPYFVYNLALGDEVSTVASAEGPLVAVEPTQRSGMLTFRVVFDSSDDRWHQLMRDLEQYGHAGSTSGARDSSQSRLHPSMRKPWPTTCMDASARRVAV